MAVDGRYSFNVRLSTGDVLNIGLSTGDFLSTWGCLRLIFFQPWVVCGLFSVSPGRSAVDLRSTLGWLRVIVSQRWVVCWRCSVNLGLFAVDLLSAGWLTKIVAPPNSYMRSPSPTLLQKKVTESVFDYDGGVANGSGVTNSQPTHPSPNSYIRSSSPTLLQKQVTEGAFHYGNGLSNG